MAVYRRSRRHRFFLVLLVLTSVTVITLDYHDAGGGALETMRRGARDALAPLQSVASDAFSPVGDFFGGLTKYGSLKAENARLREQLDQAKGNALSEQGAEQEREALLSLMQLDFAGNIPAVAARVVSLSPSNFQNTIVIDRGTDQRVAVGLPVVSGAGLVGRVVDASKTRATVQLLDDRASSVGVRLTTSNGAIGVASGTGANQTLKVDFVGTDAAVTPGEAVVTSGISGSAYPPEIPVGKVHATTKAPGALQQDITVDPSVDFSRLEFVKVLLWGQS